MEFHIQCQPEAIARYALVPGSHARAQLIAQHLEDCRLVSDSRGYLVYTGFADGVRITAASTGMGGPSTAIALEELARLGATTFIRVGSCGTPQDYVDCGDVIIATGTFRSAGTANAYLPPAFPAVPTFAITRELVRAAARLNLKVHVGLGSAGDAFYAPNDDALRETLKQVGILSGEMESDTLFVIGAYRGWRTGALYVADGTSKEIKPVWGEEAFRRGEQNAIRIAIETVKALAQADAVG
ncbi:MAG: nucleoside phosphorylase [Anaerolineae bacterium]|jgi:uridine phosphorylase|nr:nucleoside phosphorylase [Anaerolineae bacterium]